MKSCVSSQLPEFPQPPSNLWTPLVKSSHKPLSERATCHKKCSHHKLSQKMFPSTSDVTSYHVTLSHLGKGVCQLKFLRKDEQDGLMTECDPQGSELWIWMDQYRSTLLQDQPDSNHVLLLAPSPYNSQTSFLFFFREFNFSIQSTYSIT